MNPNENQDETWKKQNATVPVRGGILATASTPSGTPKVPAHFKVLSELGRGGMAVVYHAYDSLGSREVALKFICQNHDSDAVKRFRREATDLATVFHPHIVDFYSAGELHGQEFIEMEYVAGGTLKAFAENCDSLSRLLLVFAQICEGLEHIHQAGMVHRDIKPANILMTTDGKPKISDLGLARRSSVRSDITEMGTVMGTAAYLAPEQIMSHSVGPAADLYALGVTLFEAVTGQHPFPADSPVAIIRAHLQQQAPLASTLLPGLPSRLDKLIAATLEKDPLDRMGSAAELRKQLEICAGELQAQQDRLTAASPQALLERARRHLEEKRPEEALSLLDKLAEAALDQKTQAEVLTERARALEQQGDPEAQRVAGDAVRACRASGCSRLGNALLVLGKAAMRAGVCQEALAALREAREVIPSSARDQQIELLETLAKLHESGANKGFPGLSFEEAARYREIASGLRQRLKSTGNPTTYEVVFSESGKLEKRPRRLEALAAVACLLLVLAMGGFAPDKAVPRDTQDKLVLAPEMGAPSSTSSARKGSRPAPRPARPQPKMAPPQPRYIDREERVVIHVTKVITPLSAADLEPAASKAKVVVAAPLQLPKPEYKLAAPRAVSPSEPEPGLFPEVSDQMIEEAIRQSELKRGTPDFQEVPEPAVAQARQKMREAALRARNTRSRARVPQDGFGSLSMGTWDTTTSRSL